MAQTLLALDTHPADARTGFEIGWDHAHHGLLPRPEQWHDGNPVRQGWQAGKACFGEHTLGASRLVRQWLALRLHAWQRGLAFELGQVTPHYLGQLDTPLCPITRQPLDTANASIDRVCDAAAYAAGNLAMMGLPAKRAKGALGWQQALALAQRAELAIDGREQGLESAAWMRMAVLVSFVTPLPHGQAACLPLRVQPPNRLRLLNPVQGLQALVTRALGRPDGARRLRQLSALLPGSASQLDFHRFVSALLPRLIDAGPGAQGFAMRHALEDAWCDARVNRCWQRFAVPLDEAVIQRLLQRGAAAGLAGTHLMLHTPDAATEGWALATRGRVEVPTPDRRLRAWQVPGTLAFRETIAASRSRTADGPLPA